jgi:GWxTD domain-containing protein
MKFILITILFLSTVKLFAQIEEQYTVKKNLGDAIYFQDFVNSFSDKPGYTQVDVFVQVPYKKIVFVKSPQGFTAKYSFTASVFDSAKTTLLVEKTWNETINVIDYNAATAKENYNISKRSFDLKPGTYSIKTSLEDLDSKKEANSEVLLKVKDFGGNISVSDILLVSKKDNSQSNNEIIPNVSKIVPSPKDRIEIYFEIKSKDTVDTKINLKYKVINSDNTAIHEEENKEYNIKPGVNQILHTMSEFPFDMGMYEILVILSDDQGKEIASSKKAFYSHSRDLPFVINDIDKAIAEMIYIANPSEMDYMEEGKDKAERTKRFMEFWKKRDPSPNNDENEIFDEYFKRVSYANENFSTYIDGWKTDRGMVFILLGPPNNIDRHPFEYDSKPYEIWEYYNLNRSFIFVDETGFGDYKLITPLTGDVYRFRY